MTSITFVRARWNYDSYIDLFRLAELAGFPIIYIDELDISKPGVYIMSPHTGGLRLDQGEWNPHIVNQDKAGKRRNAHLVQWKLERPALSAGSVGKYAAEAHEMIALRLFDEIWVSDRRLADETKLRYVTLGSHTGLGEPGPMEDKNWAFTHQSYVQPRRQTVLSAFTENMIGPNSWPPERDDVLRRSKFGLAMHQDNHPFMEPLRMALFAAYGLPTLVETILDAYPYGSDVVEFASYTMLASRMRRMLDEEYRGWYEKGLKLRARMVVEYEFGRMVRQAVEQSVGDWR